jgi:hypothetical protein
MLTFETNETLDEARARNVRDALFEDIGCADWTGRLVPEGRRVRAHEHARSWPRSGRRSISCSYCRPPRR